MSDANVVENDVPEGWYDDPAKAGMQRWWSGTDWTDHVRYAGPVRLHAVVSQAPEAVEPPAPVHSASWAVADTAEQPWPAIASRPDSAIQFPLTAASPAQPAFTPEVDNYYVPMRPNRSFSTGSTAAYQMTTQRRSAKAIGLWVALLAVVGIAAGVALWVFLPH